MDISEKAKEYAKGRALDAISAAIEKAYFDGYKDGLKHYEKERLESIVEGIEYVDLELPSGTKWASYYVGGSGHETLLSYNEAKKLSIPTKAEFEELCKECQIDHNFSHYLTFTGLNGNSINLLLSKITNVTNDNVDESVAFWLEDDSEDKFKNYARVLSSKAIPDSKAFMGYKMPVILVLRKDKV